MLKKFPLFYIALLYIFSTKDKIVFFMQQFALLIIALCIAVIICSFSLINGWKDQVTRSTLAQVSPVVISTFVDKQDKKVALEMFNWGFEDFTPQNTHIKSIVKKRFQQTYIVVDNNKIQVSAFENPQQSTPISINSFLQKQVLQSAKNKTFSLFDPSYYNAFFQMPRAKQYQHYTVNQNEQEEPEIELSTDEYQKVFHNENYNAFFIYLDDPDNALEVANDLKIKYQSIKEIKISYWKELNKSLFDALDLQQKIFVLIYTILFILLCAIIISTNIAFFKEKRKDWALLKILNIVPNSVEKIFLYKSILSFIISMSLGLLLGVVITIYSNEILIFIGYITGTGFGNRLMFGTQKITYLFNWKDFLLTFLFSFSIFFINFIILICVFRKESTANFLRTQ